MSILSLCILYIFCGYEEKKLSFLDQWHRKNKGTPDKTQNEPRQQNRAKGDSANISMTPFTHHRDLSEILRRVLNFSTRYGMGD